MPTRRRSLLLAPAFFAFATSSKNRSPKQHPPISPSPVATSCPRPSSIALNAPSPARETKFNSPTLCASSLRNRACGLTSMKEFLTTRAINLAFSKPPSNSPSRIPSSARIFAATSRPSSSDSLRLFPPSYFFFAGFFSSLPLSFDDFSFEEDSLALLSFAEASLEDPSFEEDSLASASFFSPPEFSLLLASPALDFPA